MLDEKDRGAGLCWGCDYPLRGIESSRCPECGRGFDVRDVGTMNMGRPRRAVGRWAVRPVSWVVVGAGVLGTLLVLIVSRFPVRGVESWFVDLRGVTSWRYWQGRWIAATWAEALFAGGIAVWVIVLLGWWGGEGVRWIARIRYGAPRGRRRAWGRHVVLFLMLAVTGVVAAVGWPFRVGEGIVARDLATKGNSFWVPGWPQERTTPEQEVRALWSVALDGWSARARMGALRVVIEQHPSAARIILLDVLEGEKDPVMKAWELRLIGGCFGEALSDDVGKYLDDADSRVRAAAADAMGLLVYGIEGHPELTVEPSMSGMVVPTTVSDPPIGLYAAFRDWRSWQPGQRSLSGAPISRMSERWRTKLMSMITKGVSAEERRAAAQAAAGYAPPGYRLRLAEWGVWLEGAGADGGRLQGVLSDIPGFVHATGDSLTSLQAMAAQRAKKRRSAAYTIVTKPVIHLTVNMPLAVKLKVLFQMGRPWFAYPMPDCYSGPAGTPIAEPAELDPGTLGRIGPQLRWGYDWLLNPSALMIQGGMAAGVNGVAWENLIVSPFEEGWMRPAEVGSDAKFEWWRRLREVESSWVNNGDESERFLYYDGPTMLRCPVEFGWEKGRVVVRGAKLAAGEHTFLERQKMAAGPMRQGLLVTVHDGEARAQVVSIPVTEKAGGGKWPVVLGGKDVAGKADEVFLKRVVERGLTASEAQGMVASWRKAFFETEGVRLLMFLSAEDYGVFCPIEVRPAATEMARVGVIWVEF